MIISVPCYFFRSKKGGCVTGTPLTKKSTDHSCRDYFEFSFYCDCCEKSWRSEPLPFANGGFTRIDCGKVRDLIWDREHRVAFERANLEAQFHFSHCPVCGKWVCDDCFNPLGSDGRDLCRDCEAKLARERAESGDSG